MTGFACAVGAAGVRLLLDAGLPPQQAWQPFFLGVLLASVLGGAVAATTATGASALLGDYLFLVPLYGFREAALPHVISLASFIIVSSCIGIVGATLRRFIREQDERSAALEAARKEAATDRAVLLRLYALAERCARPGADRAECLDEVLAIGMWITGADKGMLQLCDDTSAMLTLTTQRGFSPRFLDFFATVERGDSAACGAAFASGGRIVVEDIGGSPVFAGPARAVLLDEGIRAVQSTPLSSGAGAVVGMVSTHFTRRHRPSERECHLLDLLARLAADYLERARADDAARIATEQLHIVTDSMAAPVTRCSRDLRYVWVSTPYAEWIGRTIEDIAGHPIRDVLGPEAFAQLRPHFDRVLAGEVVRYEERVPFTGIGLRWVSATYTPTSDEHGHCDGWVAVVIDVDARKKAEEALQHANRRKDEFLAMLGHELRNPLSAVRNALATASLDEARRPRAMEIARRQADQLGRLIDDLLDVARITQGRIVLRKECVDVRELVDRALEGTRDLIEARGVRLVVERPSAPIPINADPTRFEQVLGNLLSNAAKYTNAGGRIDVTTERSGDEVAVAIRDTGIGIAPELLPGLWDLFAQADRSLDRAQGGLGIGLTVARRLIELHGGRLEGRSGGLGKGAEFIVTMTALPAAADEPHTGPGAAPQLAPQRAARVLLVEDNPDTAESLTLLLELLGHRVRSVSDGVAALDAARANAPDVMLLDIGLPGIDGYEVARCVRRDPDLKHIVLVALTGYGRDEDKKQAMAAGFDYHVVKPVSPEALQGLMTRLAHTSENDTVH